jgi:hypothetical protein
VAKEDGSLEFPNDNIRLEDMEKIKVSFTIINMPYLDSSIRRPATLNHPSPKEMAIEIEKSNSPAFARLQGLINTAKHKHYQFKKTPALKKLAFMTSPISPAKQKIIDIKNDRKNFKIV